MKRVNLALQGGGAHGAFAWGALDAILEDERLEIAGVSGASSGAMNAVVMAAGLAEGREQARAKLTKFWRALALESGPGATIPVVDAWASMWRVMFAPASVADAAAQASTPYAFNPFNINPLRDTLAALVDFEKLRQGDGPKLFVAATNVRTGMGTIFRRDVLTPEHVIASATLPHLFQAAVIDGEPYWDGGYSGNPPLWPLFYETDCRDAIIVQINPITRKDTPQTPDAISNRIDEITFNASLLAELRAADFVARLVREGVLNSPRYRLERLHRIGGHGKLEDYPPSSKFDISWRFLQQLRDLGRDSAKLWLEQNYAAIGERSTLDIAATLQKPATD
ncbi:MAG TPA: patatin-like phospholipase family protein [Roseiarcus sp.]|nr:patatin-like phospholipase family protein [Roseiarcus sp.]